MAQVSVAKLKVRRGTDSQRKLITLDEGELGYTTDVLSKRVFIGDGFTAGGNPVGIKFFLTTAVPSGDLQYAQIGDLAYNKADSKVYTLTAANYNSAANWFPIT